MTHKTQFGLTLPNRGVITGATTVEELLALAQKADEAGWDSVWVGDYTTDYSREYLENWVALGSPLRCIDKLQSFIDAGATTITLRLTSYSQDDQFKRVTDEVLSAFH